MKSRHLLHIFCTALLATAGVLGTGCAKHSSESATGTAANLQGGQAGAAAAHGKSGQMHGDGTDDDQNADEGTQKADASADGDKNADEDKNGDESADQDKGSDEAGKADASADASADDDQNADETADGDDATDEDKADGGVRDGGGGKGHGKHGQDDMQ